MAWLFHGILLGFGLIFGLVFGLGVLDRVDEYPCWHLAVMLFCGAVLGVGLMVGLRFVARY